MLTSCVRAIGSLADREIDQMWAVFRAHFEDVSRAAFDADLGEKDGALLLHDGFGAVQGFSTYRVIAGEGPQGPAHFLFSGDTIIDQGHWGRNDFALSWIRHAGRLAAEAPAGGLWWFLIVKGHRTYRYLPTFAHAFHPHPEEPTPPGARAAIDRLARERFGADYDAAAGVVRFETPHGRLTPQLAEIPEKDRRRADVAFFLAANPGYARGDELVCLCRLSAENLKPIARRAFEAGAPVRAEPEPALC